jgi:hypothetical protein
MYSTKASLDFFSLSGFATVIRSPRLGFAFDWRSSSCWRSRLSSAVKEVRSWGSGTRGSSEEWGTRTWGGLSGWAGSGFGGGCCGVLLV